MCWICKTATCVPLIFFWLFCYQNYFSEHISSKFVCFPLLVLFSRRFSLLEPLPHFVGWLCSGSITLGWEMSDWNLCYGELYQPALLSQSEMIAPRPPALILLNVPCVSFSTELWCWKLWCNTKHTYVGVHILSNNIITYFSIYCERDDAGLFAFRKQINPHSSVL